jgi:hypothetical protein
MATNDNDTSTDDTQRCDLCRERAELRPVCIENREEVPLLCSACCLTLETAGRIDRERDADVFGYSKAAIQERIA